MIDFFWGAVTVTKNKSKKPMDSLELKVIKVKTEKPVAIVEAAFRIIRKLYGNNTPHGEFRRAEWIAGYHDLHTLYGIFPDGNKIGSYASLLVSAPDPSYCGNGQYGDKASKWVSDEIWVAYSPRMYDKKRIQKGISSVVQLGQ